MHKKLAAVGDLSRGPRLNRILANPLGYVSLFIQRKIAYPLTKKGSSKICKTFFDTEMKVILPAAFDLYLTGAKTHDSEVRLGQFLIKNLQLNDKFLDIGAHFGYFTLLASKIVGPSGKVMCVEASAEMFKILHFNTKPHTNIEINHLAASDKNEVMEFYEFPILYSEYNSIDLEQYKGANWFKKFPPKKISVEGIMIDDLLDSKKFLPKVIKIDVEGAEDKVINGMKSTLKNKSVDFIAMEFITNREKKVHLAAAKTLNDFQYYPHYIESDGNLREIPLNEIEAQMQKNNLHSDNIIFKPK